MKSLNPKNFSPSTSCRNGSDPLLRGIVSTAPRERPWRVRLCVPGVEMLCFSAGIPLSLSLSIHNYSNHFWQKLQISHFSIQYFSSTNYFITSYSLCNAKPDQLQAHETTLSTLLFCSVVRKRVSFAKASKLESDDNSVARARHSTFPCSGGVWKTS